MSRTGEGDGTGQRLYLIILGAVAVLVMLCPEWMTSDPGRRKMEPP
ncbi:MAG: hypothetical protein M3Q23_10100 [Actinomycetota bacterium]|nr:hypothetical protein [Actinomycetota bacterium]